MVSKVKSVPGISDHNMVFSNFKLVCHRQKLNKRKIFHFNKADWDQARTAANTLCRVYFSRNLSDISVGENCVFIEKSLQEILAKFVPCKFSKSKQSYPWITREVKRLQRKRDKAYIQVQKSKDPKIWRKFRKLNQAAKRCLRQCHRAFINNIVGNSL